MAQSASLTAARLQKVFQAQAKLSESRFNKRHGHAVAHFQKQGTTLGAIRNFAAKVASTGILAGSLLVVNPTFPQVMPQKHTIATKHSIELHLVKALSGVLPKPAEQLTPEQEATIARALYANWGIKASAELDGNRLNHSWGYMGAEQHLPRYPGDTVHQHDAIQKSGITPGKSAWGYMTQSRAQLTNDVYLKEKYYIAVQTLYLPTWNTNTKELKDWFKHRKMLVINPKTGKSIVVVVADAGPAKWTGKQFGGSPEVMAYLGFNVGRQKGEALVFFVDDPDNLVPLGPLEYTIQTEGPLTVI